MCYGVITYKFAFSSFKNIYFFYKTSEFLAANKEKPLAVKLIQAGKAYFENTETEDAEMNELHKKYQEVYSKLVNG